jgi:hypothetical protein
MISHLTPIPKVENTTENKIENSKLFLLISNNAY